MVAEYFNEPDWEEYNNKNWDDVSAHLYDNVLGGNAEYGWQDDFGKMLFDIAFVHTDASPDVNATARDMLYEWMETEYGIDFESEFDWDTWRENYG